jgi:DNA-binding CsgD family transcriptional regulator
VPRVSSAIVGRELELKTLEDFVARPGFSALLIEGEAGIGKSTLWWAGVEQARERGRRVLLARPAEAEAQLAFGSLADLVEPVLAEALAPLPAPQRHALEVALLLAEAERAPEPRAIALALLSALRGLAANRPLVVAVDDVQWLDPASADALSFAIRRLEAEPIVLLLSRRGGEGEPLSLGLDRALPKQRPTRLTVGPLSLGALHRLLGDRLGVNFNRPTLIRLAEVSGGNPFFALELGRVLRRRGGTLFPAEELPIPDSLDELVRARLRALPAGTRMALAAVAALAEPELRLVEREGDLDPAFDAHVIELDGKRVRFAHPLLAAGAYEFLAPGRRRTLHRRLASALDDPDERARHLALGMNQADETAAAIVGQAAERLRVRGAPRAAAGLFEQARRLTPSTDHDSWARRGIEAARCYHASGDASSALRLSIETVETLEPSRRRAEALFVAAETVGSTDRALELCDRAFAEAAGDPALQARILQQRSELAWVRDDLRQARADALSAVRLADMAGDEQTLVAVLGQAGATAAVAGADDAADLLARAQAIADRGFSVESWRSPEHWRGVRHLWRDELEQARGLLCGAYERALERGDDNARGALCLHLAQLELRAGAWGDARRYAAEGDELYLASGLAQARSMPLAARTSVEAYCGNVQAARSFAADGLAAIGEVGDRFIGMHYLVALGSLELSLGDHAAAVRQLEDLPQRLERVGVSEPALFPFQADLIEALVGLGRLEQAATRLDELELQAHSHARPRLLAWVHRSRGILLSARGDVSASVEELEAALTEHEALPVPFERGRTLLALGAAQRRAKRWGAARESLEAALATFDQLGAALWAERARSELGRIGGRAPASGELTPTEQRVAELVASGLSNKEVASALFLSRKTVEANLARVYRKLGVRSRAELARRFATPAG